MTDVRQPQHPVDPQFTARWSPRAFTGAPIDEATLRSLFEASRWAPSAFNAQPWRFVWGRAGTPAWEPIFSALIPFNQTWAQNASALIAVLSRTRWVPPGKEAAEPIPSHAFDTGAAWAALALQAEKLGWRAHGIGGFDQAGLRRNLRIPDDYAVNAIVAIGKQGDKSLLPEFLQRRETPSGRLPVDSLAAEGRFAFPGDAI